MIRALKIAVLALGLAMPSQAQQSEIFIPNRDGNLQQEQEAPQFQSRLAACLANADPASCTGIDLDPDGLALESAAGAPSIQFETLVLDLNDGAVTSSEAPPDHATDYVAPVNPTRPVVLPAVAITIEFDFNSASIRPDQFGKLQSLIAALTDPGLVGASFAVIGHTDAVGSERYNCGLSGQRANSVTNALLSAYVRLPLYPVGFGEHVLKNPYNPRAAENRRVTFLRLPDDYGRVLQTATAVCRY